MASNSSKISLEYIIQPKYDIITYPSLNKSRKKKFVPMQIPSLGHRQVKMYHKRCHNCFNLQKDFLLGLKWVQES